MVLLFAVVIFSAGQGLKVKPSGKRHELNESDMRERLAHLCIAALVGAIVAAVSATLGVADTGPAAMVGVFTTMFIFFLARLQARKAAIARLGHYQEHLKVRPTPTFTGDGGGGWGL